MAKREEEKQEGDAAVAVETPDSPLLDLTDAAVKRMLKLAKKRGWVTYSELNAVLPSEEISSDQIEDMIAMLNEMGINVVESEESDGEGEEENAAQEEDEPEGGELVEVAPPCARRDPHLRAGRAHRRSGAHVPARDGLGRASVARRRNRHRQAHRGRPRGDDRRALRKPAHLPGDHHLARRAQRRQDPAARHHRSRGDLCRPRRQEHAEDRSLPRIRRARRRRPRRARPRQASTAMPSRRSAKSLRRRRRSSRIPCRSRPWKPN